MATATKNRKTTTKKAAVPAPAPEPEIEDDDLEELEEDQVEESPKSKRGGEEVTFGVSDVCAMLARDTGKPVTPRELRTLIRKMAREDNPRVQREIVAGNRQRYSWSGPEDPQVKAIIAAFKGGELEADKREKLQALKDRKTAAKNADPEAVPASKKSKKAAPVVEEDEEILELEDEDD